jgi:hypothetical protein
LDYDKKLGGGEGKLFRSKIYEDKTLKRWFSSQLYKFDKSVDLLDGTRRMIVNDPELNKYIKVVKIYEKGQDWILRDYFQYSYELRQAIKREMQAKISYEKVLDLLKNTNDYYLQVVFERLDRAKPSANMHWDAKLNKIIIIDMM